MKKTRILIKEINEGKNLEENIPIYMARTRLSFRNMALLNFTMDYYVLAEMLVEETDLLLPFVKESVDKLQAYVKALFFHKKEEGTLISDALSGERKAAIRRQEALTACVDKLSVYEYAFNRMEMRFASPETLAKQKEELLRDEQGFLWELMRYVFKSEDRAVVSERLKKVLGQLPVRMTKSKFFELLAQSLTLFKGAQKDSLERYLYLIRTSGMAYEPEEGWEGSRDFDALSRELEMVDYKTITHEEFTRLQNGLEEAAKRLGGLSELYTQLDSLVNCLMAYSLTRDCAHQTSETCERLIQTLYQKMEQKETFDEMEDSLYDLEGCMEKEFEEMTALGAVLYQMEGHSHPLLCEPSVRMEYETLKKMQKLLSNSLYVDLERDGESEGELVDASYVERRTKELLEDFELRFQRMQKPIVRGSMAAVLSTMAPFLNSVGEAKAYVEHAFHACTDVPEKMSSIRLLRVLMKREDW